MKMKKYAKFAIAAALAGVGIFLFYLSAASWGRMLLAKDRALLYLSQPLNVQAAEEAVEKSGEEKQTDGGQEDGTKTMPTFCIWGQKDAVEIANANLHRSAQADAILMCGNPELLFEDCRLPGSEDKQGCLLDEKAAWELFGSSEVVGKEVSYEGKPYFIRKVIPGKEGIFAFQAGSLWGSGNMEGGQTENGTSGEEPQGEGQHGGDGVLNRITMQKPEEKSLQDLATLWDYKYGVSAEILDLQLLRGIGGFCVLLVPLTSCVYFLWYLCRQYRNQQQLVWKVVVAALGLMMAACFFVLLKGYVHIPDDYIPTRWSDFSFWSQLWRQKGEALRMLGQMPKSTLDSGWMGAFAQTLGCGVFAEMAVLPLGFFCMDFTSEL